MRAFNRCVSIIRDVILTLLLNSHLKVIYLEITIMSCFMSIRMHLCSVRSSRRIASDDKEECNEDASLVIPGANVKDGMANGDEVREGCTIIEQVLHLLINCIEMLGFRVPLIISIALRV